MTNIRSASDIGAAVRARRKAKGLSQAELAALSGSSIRFITELERGERTEASVTKVLTVLQRLGLDVTITAREERA